MIGAGLIGSQVARILVERGERPVLMDFAAQPQAISQIVVVVLVGVERMRGHLQSSSTVSHVRRGHGGTLVRFPHMMILRAHHWLGNCSAGGILGALLGSSR